MLRFAAGAYLRMAAGASAAPSRRVSCWRSAAHTAVPALHRPPRLMSKVMAPEPRVGDTTELQALTTRAAGGRSHRAARGPRFDQGQYRPYQSGGGRGGADQSGHGRQHPDPAAGHGLRDAARGTDGRCARATGLARGESWPAGRRCALLPARWDSAASTRMWCWRASRPRGGELTARERALLSSAQDAELFLFTSEDRIAGLAAIAARLSRAGVDRCRRGSGRRACKRAVARGSDRIHARRTRGPAGNACGATANTPDYPQPARRSFRRDTASRPRIGFLFPGQGSLPPQDRVQPAIVKASLAALGEFAVCRWTLPSPSVTAWANSRRSVGRGALDEAAAIDHCGRARSDHGGSRGAAGSHGGRRTFCR